MEIKTVQEVLEYLERDDTPKDTVFSREIFKMEEGAKDIDCQKWVELLEKFKESRKKIRPAFEKMIENFEEETNTQNGEEIYKEIFGEDSN